MSEIPTHPQVMPVPNEGARSWLPWVQAVILALLIWLLFRIPLKSMFTTWRVDSNWSHGMVLPFFSVYFFWLRTTDLHGKALRGSYFGFVPLLAGLCLYYAAATYRFMYPQQFAILPCLLGLVLLVYGWRMFRIAWFPIVYLVFAIPLPAQHYFDLTMPLRRLACGAGSLVLGTLPGVLTEVSGVVIEWAYGGGQGTLNVAEACSGMRSLMGLCAIGVGYAYIADRPLWQRIILLLSCLPTAIFCNMIRVVITGMLQIYGLQKLADDAGHFILGIMMYAIALGVFLLLGFLLDHLFVDAPVEEDEPAAPAEA